MNPNLCRIVLRPRSTLEVFDLTLLFIRENRKPLTRLLIPVLVVCLGFVPICWLFDGSPWLLLLPLPFVPVVQAAYTAMGGRLLFRPTATLREVLSDLFSATGHVVGASLWGLAGLALSTMTCGYAAIPVAAALLFLPEAALLERVGTQRSLRRTLRLSGARVVAALSGTVAWFFLTVWMALVVEGFGQALLDTTLQLGQPLGAVLAGQVTPFFLAGLLLAQPLHALYRLLLYVDVRTRVEGWDLQVAFRAASKARGR